MTGSQGIFYLSHLNVTGYVIKTQWNADVTNPCITNK